MKHKITKVGPEEHCGDFNGTRPSIDVDSKNLPHIIIDNGVSKDLYIFHKTDKWTQKLFARGEKGGKYDAGRLYMPHLEIDKKDRAWISCKFGVKEWGSMMGQGVWLVGDVANNPHEIWFRHVNVHKGNGNVSINKLDSSYGIVLGTLGNWQQVNEDGSMGPNGSIKIGPSGEKIRFLIAPITATDEKWHVVMGGYSKSDNMYGWAKKKNYPWADKNKYPEMGSDMIHPGIGIDSEDPKICYMSVVYNPGVLINVWGGNKMLFPKNNLPIVSKKGNTGTDRFGPQWAPAKGGGAYLCWTQSNEIRMAYIGQDGSISKHLIVCKGKRATICTDTNGDVHLAYVYGGMKYRKLETEKEPGDTTTTTTLPPVVTTTTTTPEEIMTTTTTTRIPPPAPSNVLRDLWKLFEKWWKKVF